MSRHLQPNTYRRLPPLQSLVVFESAARHLNFTAAAEELCSTQPAVSQRVRSMEADLGTPLFQRLHRGVRLTAEGQRLYETVRDSLDALHAATQRVEPGVLSITDRPVVSIATDFGFAKLWLMPRMHLLRRALPDLQLRVLASQDPGACDDVDFRIVFDRAPRGRAQLLLPEQVVPVCAPSLLQQRRPLRRAGELASLPLLHLDGGEPGRWMDWAEWFSAQGVPHPGGASVLSFNDYSLVVQAAVEGHGVALGWAPLVDELLDRGALVIAHDRPVQTERGYFLMPARDERLHGLQALLRDWLVGECRRTDGVRALLEGRPPRELAALASVTAR